jgi:hypothetical protein
MLDSRDTWSCSSAVILPCRPPGSAAAAFSAARLRCFKSCYVPLHSQNLKGFWTSSQPEQSVERYDRQVTPLPLPNQWQAGHCPKDERLWQSHSYTACL